jgi:hypothetical protein
MVDVVDPWTGTASATIPLTGYGYLYGGRERAVHAAYTLDDAFALTTIEPSGDSHVVTSDYFDLNSAAVVGDTFYTAGTPWKTQQPLFAADLSSGALAEVAYPTAPAGRLTLGVVEGESHGQLLVDLSTADVDASCGGFDCVVSILEYDAWIALYDPGSDAWREAGRGFRFDAFGTTTDGTVIGRVRAPAGDVFVGWDPLEGTMAVADAMCPAEDGESVVVTGDTAWWLEIDTRSPLMLTPYAVTVHP